MADTILKPCPFCGGKARILKGCTDYKVECCGVCADGICGVQPSTRWYKSKNTAIKVWNFRKDGENENA